MCISDQSGDGHVPLALNKSAIWPMTLQRCLVAWVLKIVRNHVAPYLDTIRLDKLTATRIATHYRELETSGWRDMLGFDKLLSANTVFKVHVVHAPCWTPRSMTG